MTRVPHHVDDSSNASNGDSSGWRIVLVGQSGLDRPLRREADVELIRVRNGIEAIGELAQPIDAHSPKRAAILITPSAVDAEELTDLAAGLRQIDPLVRVLGIGAADGAWHRSAIGTGAIDGTVSADADAPEVREALHAARPHPVMDPPAPDIAPLPTIAEPIEAIHIQSSDTQSPAGDHDQRILSAMLRGGPAGPVCLALLRERFGAGTFTWLAHGTEAAPSADTRLVPVQYHDAQLGMLAVSEHIADDTVTKTAAWLAHWLALDEQQRQLREAAFIDPLTKTWNRRFFEQHLDSVLTRAATARQHVTILLLDVHDLKHFNDAHGYAAGDAVLIETTRLLKSCVRTNDRVCRVGGDEFVVVFWDPTGPRSPGSKTPRSVTELAQRFQEKLATTEFPSLSDGAPGQLAVAGGMATFPWDGHNRENLMKQADQLLRESKKSGTNAILIGGSDGGSISADGF